MVNCLVLTSVQSLQCSAGHILAVAKGANTIDLTCAVDQADQLSFSQLSLMKKPDRLRGQSISIVSFTVMAVSRAITLCGQ